MLADSNSRMSRCLRAMAPAAVVAPFVVAGVLAAAPASPAVRADGGDPGAPQVPEAVAAAVADPGRPEADRRRDAGRRPAEVLAFFGIEPGMRVADMMGAHGYYTEILSTLVGTEGEVWLHNTPWVARGQGKGLPERLRRLGGRGNVRRVDSEPDELGLPAGELDAALLIRYYHDLFWMPDPEHGAIDRQAYLRGILEALRPGGVFGVIDHRAEDGSGARAASGERGGLHRIDEALVRREIEAAGFEFVSSSDVLSHPEDTRDWNPLADWGKRRDETDRFVLKFRKPPD